LICTILESSQVELTFASRAFKGKASKHEEAGCSSSSLSIVDQSIFSLNVTGEYFCIMRLCLSVYFLQLLATFGAKKTKTPSILNIDEDFNDKNITLTIFEQFCVETCNKMGYDLKLESVEDFEEMRRFLAEGLNHFLRISALFFNILLDIDPPEALLG